MSDHEHQDPEPGFQPESIRRLTKDLKQAARLLSHDEARYLVDAYYAMQRDRIRAANRTKALTESGEPSTVVTWLADNSGILERNIKSALQAYSLASPVGVWAESVTGIGPIISAGLLAHIDITRAPTVGHIWRFGGVDPTVKWEKGQKRPWNASLKRLLWIVGESLTKVSGHEDDVYGHLYAERKVLEEARNAEGKFADQAAVSLATKKWRGDTQTRKAYESGKLPQARLHLRAQRYAVKLFLSAWHEVAYVQHYDRLPPRPYVLTQLGHAHELLVPNMPDRVRQLRMQAGLPV